MESLNLPTAFLPLGGPGCSHRKKKLLKQFLDWKITFILRFDNVLQTDLYKRVLKFMGNFPKNGKTIISF